MPRYTINAETPIPTTPRWDTPIRNSVADFNAVPRKPLDRKLIPQGRNQRTHRF